LTKIPLITLYRWHTRIGENSSWRPARKQDVPNRRTLTPPEEKAIAIRHSIWRSSSDSPLGSHPERGRVFLARPLPPAEIDRPDRGGDR
jgi:hypothetical protein